VKAKVAGGKERYIACAYCTMGALYCGLYDPPEIDLRLNLQPMLRLKPISPFSAATKVAITLMHLRWRQ